MQIYGDQNSGNCLKVKYLADALGIEYEWCNVDVVEGGAKTDAFSRLNPFQQVPVVVLENGQVLAQSNAILIYLAHGTAWLPGDPYWQAKVNEWLFWEQYSHEPYIAVCRFHMFYLGKSKESREAWRVERGEAALDIMEKHLGQQPWLVGDQVSIADIALFAYTQVAHEGGFSLEHRPRINAWLQECRRLLDV